MKIPEYITETALEQLIDLALKEDIGDGDHTTMAVLPERAENKAKMVVKANGVIAGIYVAEKIYRKLQEDAELVFHVRDGEEMNEGDLIMTISGKARTLLTGERLALNFMQRMSGIATYTNRLVKLLEGTPAKILDTRKTTPGMRMLEKWAVKIGGGENHRFGLYDMILLKDNHIDFAGGISNAIKAVQHYLQDTNKNLKIEVETRSLQEVQEVLRTGGVDVIMLDNMDLDTMKKAVSLINGKYKTEASGGVNETTIREIALCGVDYISVGALTHSVKSLDISLLAYK